MNNIKDVVRENKSKEVESKIESLIKSLEDEGYHVIFGKIGVRTTYALITNQDSSEEIVGYTFLKDIKYYNNNVGKLKALQQAIARKQIASEKS